MDDATAAKTIFHTVSNGGVGVFRTDVGYAIVGHHAQAIERVFSIKKRSYDKPCGCFGSWEMFQQIIDVDERAVKFVDSIINKHDLPLSIVGPYRAEHPFFQNVEPFVLENATKKGTIDLLMNAGSIHREIANLALENNRGVFGSSANMSLSGSKYSFTDIEEELRSAVDVAIDSGPTKYSNPDGYGSSIIDLTTFRPFRIGICFDEIIEIARDEFGIEIPAQVIK